MSDSVGIKPLFEKKVDFENNKNFQLPEEVYTCNKWSLPSFQHLKKELNKIKSQLNEFDLEEWSRHTKHRDPSSYIIRFVKQKFQPELVTQAWCKFYECLANYPVIPKDAVTSGTLTSVHLCEAPGAFVSALNHFMAARNLELRWEWHATSLNPDHEGNSLQEMIPDDRLMRHTYKNWHFGADFTGNITKYHNHVDFLKKIGSKVWLVTADGSIDCSTDPGNQESHVEYLHYCETVTALSLLKIGGSFVLKIFTMFEDSTISLLYLLNTVFERVSILKPASSKSGNSEVYVVCLNYTGNRSLDVIWDQLMQPYKSGHFEPDKSMFDLNKISDEFLDQLLSIAEFFKRHQIKQILDNVAHFRQSSRYVSGKTHQIKNSVANRYINKYKLKSIAPHRKLVIAVDISNFPADPGKKTYFKFVNGSVRITFNSVIPVSRNRDILDVRVGQRIAEVKSSRFCSNENLAKFNNFKYEQSTGSLYQSIKSLVVKTATIVSLDRRFDTYHELQRHVFYQIFNCDKGNFLVVQVPLVTNFLVGLMFILVSCYAETFLHKTGFILLHDPTSRSFEKVRHILEVVDQVYRSVDEENGAFPCDVCQIVSPNLFYNNYAFDFVQKYNSIVFSKFV